MKKNYNLLNGQTYIAHIIDGNEFFIDFNGDKFHTDSDSHKPFWNGEELASTANIYNLKYIKNIEYDSTTGNITITNQDDSILIVRVPVLDIIDDIEYDHSIRKLILTKSDETTLSIDIGDLVDIYVGSTGAQIKVEVNEDTRHISAILIEGSISEEHLDEAIRAKINNKEYIKNVEWNASNGIITIFRGDDTELEIQAPSLDIIVNVYYNENTKKLIFVKKDGTEIEMDVSDLMDIYVGTTGEQIKIVVDENNQIHAQLLEESIKEEHFEEGIKYIFDSSEKMNSRFEFFCYEVLPGETQEIINASEKKIEYNVEGIEASFWMSGTLTLCGIDKQDGNVVGTTFFHTDIIGEDYENLFEFEYTMTQSMLFTNNSTHPVDLRGIIHSFAAEC